MAPNSLLAHFARESRRRRALRLAGPQMATPAARGFIRAAGVCSGLSVSGSFRLAADDNQPGIVGAAHHGADYEHPLASRERRGADAVDGAVLAKHPEAVLEAVLDADDRGLADQMPGQRGAVRCLDDDRA